MSRVLETIAPARMGRDFRYLLASSWTSNIGDGIALAAGPLLVASSTRSPMLVAAAVLLQRLPWLLFGLHAGALADRTDRRRLMVGAHLVRAGLLMVLCGAIVLERVDIALVLVLLFALGCAEVFADTTAGTLLPMLVRGEDLGLANSRLMAGGLTGNQLVGPPVGAALFGAAMYVPFLVLALCLILAAGLTSRLRLPAKETYLTPPTRVRTQIAEGMRWLLAHPPIRTLALVIFVFNLTWGAAWSVLVLYSLERLETGPVGYGLLTTAAAVGGLLTTVTYGWWERRFSLVVLMRGCLSLEVATHLVLAVNRSLAVALVTMLVFGAYAFLWAALSNAVRQRAVPTALQGRVGSVYMVGLFGGLVVGQALGGLLAEQWGVLAPFWFAFGGSAATLVVVWRALARIAEADRRAAADDGDVGASC